jgi:hypothetical protein
MEKRFSSFLDSVHVNQCPVNIELQHTHAPKCSGLKTFPTLCASPLGTQIRPHDPVLCSYLLSSLKPS